MIRKSSSAALAALTVIVVALSLVPAAVAASTETVLYTFVGGPTGWTAEAGLTSDGAGNLYGVTQHGGSNANGVVYELTPNGSGGWTYNVLYNFTGGSDGANPGASVTFDSQGNLYGTCVNGGRPGPGAVWELSKSGGVWSLTKSYSFNGSDGSFPLGNVILDSAGNVYGTTMQGAAGYGTVFELTPSGNSWTGQTLHTFTGGDDGATSFAGLVMDRAGNLYGTTTAGGASGQGVVFKLHSTNGSWAETVLYAFTGSSTDGGIPQDTLIRDNSGRVYGTASAGGDNGKGGVFLLRPQPTARQAVEAQGGWQITWLYHFTGGSDGGGPWSGVVFDNAGNLYGTTVYGGGSANQGVVYKLTPSPWTESVLYSFSGGNDGGYPENSPIGLVLDSSGNIYGTTQAGGSAGDGVIFKVTP
jgi:uncharacterized repeat protein (TIGR03803 family)